MTPINISTEPNALKNLHISKSGQFTASFVVISNYFPLLVSKTGHQSI